MRLALIKPDTQGERQSNCNISLDKMISNELSISLYCFNKELCMDLQVSSGKVVLHSEK